MITEGVCRLVSIDGSADDVDIDLAPDIGTEWVIVWAYGYHNDTSARAQNWRFIDSNPEMPGTPVTIDFPATAAAAASVPLGIYAFRPDVAADGRAITAEPMILTHNVKSQFVVAALTAGKKCYIRAMVIERAGIGS